MQHHDAVGQLAHHVKFVLHQQHGAVTPGFQLANEVQHHRHFVHAHARGGFVKHVDQWVQRHQHGHLELALVTVWQAGGGQITFVFQMHVGEQGPRLVQPVTMVEPHPQHVQTTPVFALHRQAHVFQHAQVGEELGQLKRPPQPGACAQRCTQVCDVAAVQEHSANV